MNSSNVFSATMWVCNCYREWREKVYKSQLHVYMQQKTAKKFGVWNMMKRCYCSEITDMDMHADKITKIIYGQKNKSSTTKEMGQKEHKDQVKICPTEHSTTVHCSIPLQINSPLKGCFISCVSSPICQCIKLNTAITHLKIIWSGQLKIHSPHLCCPAFGLLFMEEKPPWLETIPLLRTRQPTI